MKIRCEQIFFRLNYFYTTFLTSKYDNIIDVISKTVTDETDLTKCHT